MKRARSPSSSGIRARVSTRASISNPLDAANILKPSGRGIFLINGLMDEVGFRDGGRELEMRKRRDKGTAAPEPPVS